MSSPRGFHARAFERTGRRYPWFVTALAVALCGACSTVGTVYLRATVRLPAEVGAAVVEGVCVGFALAAVAFAVSSLRSTAGLRRALAGDPEALSAAWCEALRFGDRLVSRVLVAGALATVVPLAWVGWRHPELGVWPFAHGALAAAMVAGLEVVIVWPLGRAAMVPVLAWLREREPSLSLAHDGAKLRALIVPGFVVVNTVTAILTATLVSAADAPGARAATLVAPAMLGLGVTTAALWGHVALLLDPLERLIRGVRSIDGKTGWRAGVLGVGEVGVLGESFDAMLDRLQGARVELVERERMLLHAQRLESLGTLAAGVAHEINNPTAGIALTAEYLRRVVAGSLEGAEREAALEALGDVTDAVRRIRGIVDQLRVHARADPGAGPEVFDLGALVRETVPLARLQGSSRVAVLAEATEGLCVRAPREPTRQVLLNLVTNAVHAVEALDRPRVDIRCHARGDEAVLEVCDNGPGVPPAHRERVFEPFFTTKPAGVGTGLGLYVSRNIVRGAGGELEIESQPSVFRVRLPRAAAAEPGLDARPPPDLDRVVPIRLLFVDDDVAVRRAFARAFAANLGALVTCDGVEALSTLAGGSFDAVMSDLDMPGISGLQLLDALREQRPELAQRFCLVTGKPLGDELRLRLGVPVLQKPMSAADVLSWCDEVAGRSLSP